MVELAPLPKYALNTEVGYMYGNSVRVGRVTHMNQYMMSAKPYTQYRVDNNSWVAEDTLLVGEAVEQKKAEFAQQQIDMFEAQIAVLQQEHGIE